MNLAGNITKLKKYFDCANLIALKQLGIDYIQGYYFSKPVETEKFIDFIKENSK